MGSSYSSNGNWLYSWAPISLFLCMTHPLNDLTFYARWNSSSYAKITPPAFRMWDSRNYGYAAGSSLSLTRSDMLLTGLTSRLAILKALGMPESIDVHSFMNNYVKAIALGLVINNAANPSPSSPTYVLGSPVNILFYKPTADRWSMYGWTASGTTPPASTDQLLYNGGQFTATLPLYDIQRTPVNGQDLYKIRKVYRNIYRDNIAVNPRGVIRKPDGTFAIMKSTSTTYIPSCGELMGVTATYSPSSLNYASSLQHTVGVSPLYKKTATANVLLGESFLYDIQASSLKISYVYNSGTNSTILKNITITA